MVLLCVHGCLYCWLKEVDCITIQRQMSHKGVKKGLQLLWDFKDFLFFHLWGKVTQYLGPLAIIRFILELPEIKCICFIMLKHIHRFCRHEWKVILMSTSFVIQRCLLSQNLLKVSPCIKMQKINISHHQLQLYIKKENSLSRTSSKFCVFSS